MKGNTIWVLVSGLAVGFLIGRETGRRSDDKSEEKSPSEAAQSAKTPTEIPADWIKEDGLNAAAQFAGLTPAQRYNVLRLMNEKPCDCGCPHGSVAKCKKEDPGCPRAPVVLSTAIDLAKQGKSYDDIKKGTEKPAAAAQPQQPAQGPQKVELAAWTPIKGPKHAKVTIVEFSDFQ